MHNRRILSEIVAVARNPNLGAEAAQFFHCYVDHWPATEVQQRLILAHPRTLTSRQDEARNRKQFRPLHTSPAPRPHLVEEPHNRFNPAMKIRQMKLLVRRMKIVIRQPEPHHHRRNPQLPHKIPHNRNRSTPAYKHRLLAKDLGHRLRRRVHIRIVRAHHNRLARVDHRHLHLDPLRANLLHKLLVLRKRRLRLHPRNQPEADLGRSLGRNHRLRSCPNKSAGHSMHIHRGPRPGPFQHAEHRLTGQLRRPHLMLPVLLLVERQLPPGLKLRLGRLLDPVIEPRNRNMSILALQLRNHLRQRHKRIRRRSPIHPRVQIRRRAPRLKLRIDHPAQPNAQRRQIRRKHLRIRNQRSIGLQLVSMLAHERGNPLASNLFLALDNHPHIHRQLPIGLHHRLQRLHMHPHLSLVVHRTARINIPVALLGLKRRRLPLLQRLRRLHIVVPIEQHRRPSSGMQPVRIHQRMPHPLRAL